MLFLPLLYFFKCSIVSSTDCYSTKMYLRFEIYFDIDLLIKFKHLLRLILFATFFAVSTAQVVNVPCDFYHTPSYTCNLRGLEFADDLSQTFVIGGIHLPGQSNADVSSIYIEDSQTPFIITQLFASFPNAQVLKITSSGLTRIQPNGFLGGGMLREVTINNNPLRTLSAHAFIGALGIHTLDLRYNELSDVDVDMLYGMHDLFNIYLTRNYLERLPANVFLFRRNLRVIELSQNRLDVLPGNLFVPTPLVNRISLSHNQINAVGRDLISGLNYLTTFEILDNRCIDKTWIVGDDERTRYIPEALEDCFRNYEAMQN